MVRAAPSLLELCERATGALPYLPEPARDRLAGALADALAAMERACRAATVEEAATAMGAARKGLEGAMRAAGLLPGGDTEVS